MTTNSTRLFNTADLLSQKVLLDVRDVSKRYKNGEWANRNISFQCQRGEILGIVGPNSAGKTTLVRQITTELLISSGRIEVLGFDVVKEPTIVKNMLGIVPQDAELFDYLTVFQHLRIFGKLRGLSSQRSVYRANELINELHLMDYRDRPVKYLSGGMERRLMIGMAVAADPYLLVLDEPTSGLDVESRRDLWNFLKRYKDKGSGILITTHYMEEAELLCDRIGIIQKGHLLAMDTLDGLRGRVNHQYRLTYKSTERQGESVIVYGINEEELVRKAKDQGIDQYSVAPASLEDIYISITQPPTY